MKCIIHYFDDTVCYMYFYGKDVSIYISPNPTMNMGLFGTPNAPSTGSVNKFVEL